MCGRFVSSSTPDDLADHFGATWAPADDLAVAYSGPNYNVAPTDPVLAVRTHDGARRIDAFRWGLVPPWAKDLGGGAKLINARVETLASRSAFRKALAARRCIVAADGFYEWTKVPGHRRKQPWFIHRPDGELYAFAGLWERWRPADAAPWVLTCTIITGPANEAMAELHDRMPVVLPPSRWGQWLDPAEDDVERLTTLLEPTPREAVAFHPVSITVNTVGNGAAGTPGGGAALIEPVDVIDPDATAAPRRPPAREDTVG